jgi:hypothetical protein
VQKKSDRFAYGFCQNKPGARRFLSVVIRWKSGKSLFSQGEEYKRDLPCCLKDRKTEGETGTADKNASIKNRVKNRLP